VYAYAVLSLSLNSMVLARALLCGAQAR